MHWARLYAVRRHGGKIEDVMVFRAEVPHDWLKGHGNHNGVSRSTQDVPPRCFWKVIGFWELSASPLRARFKIVQR